MFDVVAKHSIAATANRCTPIKGLTEEQLGGVALLENHALL